MYLRAQKINVRHFVNGTLFQEFEERFITREAAIDSLTI